MSEGQKLLAGVSLLGPNVVAIVVVNDPLPTLGRLLPGSIQARILSGQQLACRWSANTSCHPDCDKAN